MSRKVCLSHHVLRFFKTHSQNDLIRAKMIFSSKPWCEICQVKCIHNVIMIKTADSRWSRFLVETVQYFTI